MKKINLSDVTKDGFNYDIDEINILLKRLSKTIDDFSKEKPLSAAVLFISLFEAINIYFYRISKDQPPAYVQILAKDLLNTMREAQIRIEQVAKEFEQLNQNSHEN